MVFIVVVLFDSKNWLDVWVWLGDSWDYDYKVFGWAYIELDKVKGDWVFDINCFGYSNKGYDFGDKLLVGECIVVIEYFKIL